MKNFITNIIEGLFFSNDRQTYWNYRHFGLKGEEFLCDGPDGVKISGLFLPAIPQDNGPLLGTVMYFHPCIHNYQFHLPQISWLVPSGYNVVLFDYRGSGRSAGETTLNGNVDDAQAVLRYIRGRKDIDTKRVVFFGQGPGGEAALRLLERDSTHVAGIVVESIYATHRGWMMDRYGPGVGHFCCAFLPKNIEEPEEALRKVTIPLAIVVPDRDRTIPERQVREVIRNAPEHREIWRAEGARHLNVFAYPGVWRVRFLEFAQEAVAKMQARGG